MKIDKIFAKPIDRHIEGVIKADDEARLRNEVEEYVLTDEVAAGLGEFLDDYIRDVSQVRGSANGVWISGFFGSGKSHLLKILALLMENREVNGSRLLDLFLPKCRSDSMLKAALRKAGGIPSRSILFNIDQKADVVTKMQIDALLGVFAKVFDDICGYYGKQGYIAQFERDLDKRGQYGAFKRAYREIASGEWETGREQALLESANIAAAYACVSGGEAAEPGNILDKYRNQYSLSIEDFARNVYDYVEKQGPNFRLNFFVDEAGQYIAGNVKLMTNLQTIAESLATRCRGRAWLLVTAQEDMEQVIGQMKTASANDFSKISDRFKYKLKLTSKNVAEVIRKRLLPKTHEGRVQLESIYDKQKNNFRTLFDFGDGSTLYLNYRTMEHFVDAYPFVPYQFELFQQSILALSNHNAFEGRHRSVGERSLLAVFQHVARSLSQNATGSLAPLHLMFDGIRGTLKSKIQQSVLLAEEYLDDDFAVSVLKALFIVKYIKGFKASIRNIQVLLTDRFDLDMQELRTKVETAVRLLEAKSYIHRDGEFYEFLTDEEKDVEEEIKITEIELNEISNELGDIIFDQVLKQKKIRFENGRDYPFSRKIDDRLTGREQELAIHFISPFYNGLEKEDSIKMQAMGRYELLVIMPNDERLVHDLSMNLRTLKYIRLNSTAAQRESIEEIMKEKQKRELKRLEEIKQRIKDLLSEARMFVDGTDLEIAAGEPLTRVTNGFYHLIRRTYINLPMLNGSSYKENDLRKSLSPALPGGSSEARQAVAAEIDRNKHSGRRTTLKGLCEVFEKKPYGWDLWAILCIVATLWAGSKIEIRIPAKSLENEREIEAVFRNTKLHPNITIIPQTVYTPAQVRNLKRFYEDFFLKPPDTDDAKTLGKATGEAFEKEKKNVEELVKQVKKNKYPFEPLLTEPLKLISQLAGQSYEYYLDRLDQFKDTVIEYKESVLTPVLRFVNGSSGQLYDKILNFCRQQEHNFAYIKGSEHEKLDHILAGEECFKNNTMQKAGRLMVSLEKKIKQRWLQEIEAAQKDVLEKQDLFTQGEEFKALPPDKQRELQEPFQYLINEIPGHDQIAAIRDKPRQFREKTYPKLLERLRELTAPPKADPPPDSPQQQNKPEYIALKSIKVAFDKPWLESAHDIESYAKALTIAMLTELEGGKHIHL